MRKMKTIQTTATKIDLQCGKAEENKIPTFSMRAYNGGLMQVMGFDDPVAVEVAGMEIDQKTPIREEHFVAVGHTEKIDADENGIYAEGLISKENEYSNDIVKSSRNGFPWQASIGASVKKHKYVDAGQTAIVNGKELSGPFYHILESRLNEISFVERGADSQTTAVAAKQHNKEPDMDTTKEEKQKAKEQKVPEVTASQTAAEQPKGDELAVIRAARAEETRKREINTIAATALDQGADIDAVEQLLANAMKDKSVTASSFERDMVLCQRRSENFHIGRGSSALSGEEIEAAVCISAGLEDIEKHYDERTLNAADSRFSRGLSLVETLQIFASKNGFHGSTRDVGGLLEAAYASPGSVRASGGFSTFSLPGILSNIANKFLRQGFMSVEDAWRQIASIVPVRDFKTRTSFTMTGDMTFEKVSPAGEITHGKVGEETYTNRADTYAKMFAITRQDIINDDLGALTQLPRRIGRGAALKLNDVFWGVFLDDADFFPTNKSLGNYVDGAGSALSLGGLEKANTAFHRQTDPDGKPLGIRPAILLTPVELGNTARSLMNSQLVVSGKNQLDPDGNVWRGRFTPVETTYLTAAKVWYLLANPSDLPTIEVAFLNGQQMPIVESAQADFNTLGIAMRGYHDFGVSKQEHRAAVKVKGEA